MRKKTKKERLFLGGGLSLAVIILVLLGLNLKRNYADAKVKEQDMETRINQVVKESHLFGTLVMIKAGKQAFVRSYGDANHKEQIPNQETTIYPIASLQKRMTAVMIAQLIREGKLSYQTTIDKFYPDLDHSDEITVRDLLEHTSGYAMPEVPAESILTSEETQLKNVLQTSEYLGNKDFAYSNGNYSLLAGIIRDLDHDSYEASFQKRIVKPLGLTQTFLWNEVPQAAVVPEEYFYLDQLDYQTHKNVYSESLMSTLLGAGNVYASATDLAQFELGLQQQKLLSEEEYIALFQVNRQDLVGHMGNISNDGQLGGYSSFMYGDYAAQNLMIFLVNQSAEIDFDSLLTTLYREFIREN